MERLQKSERLIGRVVFLKDGRFGFAKAGNGKYYFNRAFFINDDYDEIGLGGSIEFTPKAYEGENLTAKEVIVVKNFKDDPEPLHPRHRKKPKNRRKKDEKRKKP